ncbi:hypothetical protein DM02DRAFT_689112 [Periconia macrospinosa]|uniref:Clr5 domain-containing protein n=1 Tax=Periconia macrospinosa TaxID=97972 RepID=A0A2V1DCT5_9PLEO|nr:hypothetical protein DM02DRAFT_689112 [Periconia macrospinosa]
MNPIPNASSSSFEEKWEILKPTIEHLYLDERKKVADIARIMKENYGFDAVVHQYKHRFKKWQWKKNIPKSKMAEMTNQLESRAMAGKSGTVINYQGRQVGPQKMRRFMKERKRETEQQMTFNEKTTNEGVGIGPVLPFANSVGISVATPSAATPHNAPSPTTVALQRKTATERAHLFVQGQHEKLLISMNSEERRLMSEWLYQYWFFCFKTAKHWGKGPYNWTGELLNFPRLQSGSLYSLPGTPQDPVSQSEDHANEELTPTDLCRWFIHVIDMEYERIREYQFMENGREQDPNDESTWLPWPEHRNDPPLATRFRDALEHNDFSSIPSGELPVAISQIAKAAQRSPDELLLETLGFSIMSRNKDQVIRTMLELNSKDVDFTPLFPLHIATSYLDGHKSCCEIFSEVVKRWYNVDAQGIYVNDLGHTVLDNLMISILKSHSSATPAVLDSAWKDNLRFIGEEVDICGRWDADSPCLRQLLAKGNPSVPFSWKHKFCHTSAQTICHCIMLMEYYLPRRILLGTASGLFMRHCFHCGTKLQLQPLHTLLMTSYHLLINGCPDEDLFGMLACLLCFLSAGIDPRSTADISLSALTQTNDMEVMCDHERLTPGELAIKISKLPVVESWSGKGKIGWAVLCGVLNRCEDTLDRPMSEDEDEDEDEDEQEYWDRIRPHHMVEPEHLNDDLYDVHLEAHSVQCIFKAHRDLATLWASVQAELLTYRRLDHNMSWVSQYFSMEDLHSQLERCEPISTKYGKPGLLQTHCICGKFVSSTIPVLSEVTDPDIANLDIWERATYGVLYRDVQ